MIRAETIQRTLGYYLKLSKARLTGLVVSSTAAGCLIAPAAFDPTLLAAVGVGTALTSCSANSINQLLEIPYDSQMKRTQGRVLVRGNLSRLHAASFAATTGIAGVTILATFVNPLTALLGASNIALYTSIYTPMKRVNILNTWIGSLVGAIPPIMGWTAATGSIAPGAILLAGILFSWQFPHFNALSWNLRPEYSRAGYRMMSVTNPRLCKKVALNHTLYLLPMCWFAPLLGVTTLTFAVDSTPLNLYFIYLAKKFYDEGDSASSRNLFRFSLIYLPVVMALMIISKKREAGKAEEGDDEHGDDES